MTLALNAASQTFEQAVATDHRDALKNVAGHVHDFRDGESAAKRTLFEESADELTVWQNESADAVQQYVSAQATAVRQFEYSVNGIVNKREKNIHTLERDRTLAATTLIVDFTTNVASFLSSEIKATSADPGIGPVADAHAAHTIGAAQAWKDAIDGEANAFHTYSHNESDRRLQGSNSIAVAKEVRAGQVAGAYRNMASQLAGDTESFLDSRAASGETWGRIVADSVRDVEKSAYDDQHTAENIVIGAGRSREDLVANAILAFETGTILNVRATAQQISPIERQGEHDAIDAEVMFQQARESFRQVKDSARRAAAVSALQALAPLDDALVIAGVTKAMAERSVGAWEIVRDLDTTPVSEFEDQRPEGPEPYPGMAIWLEIPDPLDPTAGPAPQPVVPQLDPDDFEDFGTEPESAGWAAVKGTFGGLKTGVKAMTNATADMGAGLISLGQWDPDDVWAVDPMTDIGYDQSRFMASIGVNSLAGAAMGGPLAQGVGKLGQTLRFADQVDNVGQVVVGVQGAIDAVENDLNVTNGLQMVGGAAGGLGINPKPIGEATEATGKVLRGAAEGTVKAGVGAAGDVVRRAKEALAKSPEPEGKLLSPIELRMKLGDKLEELGVNLREQEFFVLGRSDKLLGDAATPFRHTGKGDLYMATEMDLLKLFGERSVLKAGGGNLDGILLTIDKQVFDKLLECQLVIKKEIDDMPGKVEYIFTADSAEILNAQGVWTRLGNEFFRGQ